MTPESAGWTYVGFDLHRLKPGETVSGNTGDREVCLVFVTGKGKASAGGKDLGILGERMSPFEGKPWSVYVPEGSSWSVTAATELELAVCATFLAMSFGILMGVYSALRRDTVLTKIFQAVSLIGISLPTFLIGILLIYLFSVTLGWLPSFGRGDVVRIGWWTTGLLTLSGLKALILPSMQTIVSPSRIGLPISPESISPMFLITSFVGLSAPAGVSCAIAMPRT